MLDFFSDEYFMREALRQAKLAFEADEVPVGAVVVINNRIIGRAYNQVITLNDPTAHAEMLAITAATNHLGSRYLNECTLYVTLEPCLMCAAALYWAQLGRLVFAATDSKQGFRMKAHNVLHPKTAVSHGTFAQEAGELLQVFFQQKRNNPKH
ncbi:MAG: nucleoside deaminase [Chitinophagales bacterium]|nr:nucleoside deaminase [Bacteroidota bacterium]MCB9042230.1 nucleoside deaminase [Chitinophagales bacterium]